MSTNFDTKHPVVIQKIIAYQDTRLNDKETIKRKQNDSSEIYILKLLDINVKIIIIKIFKTTNNKIRCYPISFAIKENHIASLGPDK